MAKKALALVDDDVAAAVQQANALLPRINAGDVQAQRDLRELLGGYPDLWASVGNLALQAELSMIKVAAGDNAVIEEAIKRKLSTMRTELLSDGASPLERLLVNRVVATWLALYYAEATYHQRLKSGIAWADNDGYQRDIDRIHRRYLAAIRTLASVQRFVLPPMQINVANRQINVAG
ncbi:MAG: hypothetical protein ACJ789_12940 [Thermomicrobiales bacterium]